MTLRPKSNNEVDPSNDARSKDLLLRLLRILAKAVAQKLRQTSADRPSKVDG